MYSRMKTDIARHEILCFELATKFEQQYEVLNRCTEDIEALKTYALVNDLHMETYLPIQSATIAYEVGKNLIMS